MRKKILFALVLVLSVSLASAAFAGQRGVYSGDEQSGCVSYGTHGFSWYHEDMDKSADDIICRNCDRSHFTWGNPKYHKEKVAKLVNKCHKNFSTNTNNRDCDWDKERYFYVDENGVEHYFTLDSDREYEVHQYQDDNGTTQYWFEATGWK
ncbi:MAG: hypothetical protein PHD36_06345 [Desulfotomaculaceae bacterium]|nr:hypothetical protein [Desulfotomaculaceae bacterium]